MKIARYVTTTLNEWYERGSFIHWSQTFDWIKKIVPTRLSEYKKALGLKRYHNVNCGRLHK